jgi:UDP-N-acetylmuramyl pentapeptide phosphotransferase/UDP-N-acetylglucosamine-1-phosphate transferase
MDKILLCSGLSFIITFFAIPVIIQVAKDKKLFDKPDERKVHKAVIPTLGGLGIFAGFIIATLLGVPQGTTSEIQYFVAASIVIFFLGLKDDILILSATKKFAGQIVAAGILIKFGGVIINNMHGFLGVYEIPHLASIVLTFLTIIVVTNSFNLIDGVDGLAGSIGILTTFIFGSYFFYINQFTYSIMAFSLTGGLIGFIIYNFPPARIFMGDTGSLLVGLINSILVIKFINIASDPNCLMPVESATTIGFAVLMLPLFDTLRVFGLRILNRRSPFSPDRNHIHHFLLDLGLSHKATTLVCLLSNLFFIAIAFSLKTIGTSYLMGFLFFIAITLTVVVYLMRERQIKKQTSNKNLHSFDNEILNPQKKFRFISEMAEAE